jgi:hypothetical protein
MADEHRSELLLVTKISGDQFEKLTDPQATGHSWWSHFHGHGSKHGAQVVEQGLGHVW